MTDGCPDTTPDTEKETLMEPANAGTPPLRAGRVTRPSRSIRWLRRPTPGEPGVLVTAVGKNTTRYLLTPLPCDIGGRAFRLVKEGADEGYDVRVGKPEECDCTCPGFCYRPQKPCKHIAGLLALAEAGQL